MSKHTEPSALVKCNVTEWNCSSLAFGDFLIDCYFANLAYPRCRLLSASYLRPLAEAIQFKGAIRYFDMQVNDVPPSVFNLRKAGIRAIISSMQQLRAGISSSTSPADTINVPHKDIRWWLACSPRRVVPLRLRHENIYLAYCSRFELSPESLISKMPGRPREVLIFPDSRQPNKQIPDSTLQSVMEINAMFGVRTTIVRVRPPDKNVNNSPNEVSLWGLTNLVRLIQEAEAIVSADSLPGHLAEYFKRPVFILTPKANEPLMPLSVLLYKRWSCFNQLDIYQQWIRAEHE